MGYIDEKLKELCEKDHNQHVQVIITLSEAGRQIAVSDLGLAGAKEIGNLGIFKGSFTCEKLLELATRVEIDEIILDFDVDTLSNF